MLNVERHSIRKRAQLPPAQPVDEILTLFRWRGSEQYSHDGVNLRQHALQCANRAREAGLADTLVAAALLHDIGHMLLAPHPDLADMQHDQRHEAVAAHWLAPRFGAAVSEPVGLHVAAKRYLCTRHDGYLERLSPGALHSLALQGGPMNLRECRRFEASPWHREALILRQLDDRSKEPRCAVPGLDAYEPLLQGLQHRQSMAGRPPAAVSWQQPVPVTTRHRDQVTTDFSNGD